MSQAALAALIDRLNVAGAGGADQLAAAIETEIAAAGGFTTDTILQLFNTTPALYNALRFTAASVVSTPASEEAAWDIQAAKAGALAAVASIGWDLNTFATLFVGSRAARHGVRLQGSALELLLNGTAYVQCTGTEVNTGSAVFRATNKISRKRGTSTASATTLTLPVDGNVIPITGSTSIQGIATSGLQSGFDFFLELPSGVANAVVHNSGAPGGGAVAIQLNAGANLTTTRIQMLHLVYNGTFFYQVG